jgi:type III pantothenate kinase
MVLGFDIGNTNTVMGVYGESEKLPGKTYRYRTIGGHTADELGALVQGFLGPGGHREKGGSPVTGVAFSSVVPALNSTYSTMAESFFGLKALEITHRCRLSITLRYDEPARLGVDRIVNAEAALREYRRDCIIVDVGTATTFCVLHADGRYDGGLIGPGIGVTIDALSLKTSQLERITFGKPEKLVATNTVDALKSGFYYGWLSLVEGIIERIELSYGSSFLSVITGGYGDMLGSALTRECIVDRLLTMKGIKFVYDLNK